MRFLGFLSKKQLTDRQIAKSVKLIVNAYSQPDVRMREMQRLLDDGSDAAIGGVLKRFSAHAQGHIADEDEKHWLEDALVERGEAVAEALRAYIRHGQELSYALRAYERIVGLDAARRFFIDVLQAYGPEDYRAVHAKLQLVLHLIDQVTVEILEALLPFLLDHSDDVQWTVLDAIDRAAAADMLHAAHLAEISTHRGVLVGQDEHGPRIQRRAAAVLADHAWPIPSDHRLVALLEEDYFLDKKNILRRRAAANRAGRG